VRRYNCALGTEVLISDLTSSRSTVLSQRSCTTAVRHTPALSLHTIHTIYSHFDTWYYLTSAADMPERDAERTRWPWAFYYSVLSPKSTGSLTCSVEMHDGQQLHLPRNLCLYRIIRKKSLRSVLNILLISRYTGVGFVAKYSETCSFLIFCLLRIPACAAYSVSSNRTVCLTRSVRWHRFTRMSDALYGFCESKSISTVELDFRHTGWETPLPDQFVIALLSLSNQKACLSKKVTLKTTESRKRRCSHRGILCTQVYC
jgi:hypothetical protein